jgi:tetratricopeptide (TPR) repeat protein
VAGRAEADELRTLRAVTREDAWDPRVLPPDRLRKARALNERVLALDPRDWHAAGQLVLVCAEEAKLARGAGEHARARRLDEERAGWLAQALVAADLPPDKRTVYERVLAGLGLTLSERERTRLREGVEQLEAATLPQQLMRLAKSFRAEEPRLPGLAVVAARRAVDFADRDADPGIRLGARASLSASLRIDSRATDAEEIASEAVELDPSSAVGWTCLIAATRQGRGGSAAVAVVEEALDAVPRARVERDAMFAHAAAAAYQDDGRDHEASRWFARGLRHDVERGVVRADELRRARELVARLRAQERRADADVLARLVREAERQISNRRS